MSRNWTFLYIFVHVSLVADSGIYSTSLVDYRSDWIPGWATYWTCLLVSLPESNTNTCSKINACTSDIMSWSTSYLDMNNRKKSKHQQQQQRSQCPLPHAQQVYMHESTRKHLVFLKIETNSVDISTRWRLETLSNL